MEKTTYHFSLDEFETMCKQHDWYYNYSDDHNVWRRGVASDHKLHQAKVWLEKRGLQKEVKKIYDKYSK